MIVYQIAFYREENMRIIISVNDSFVSILRVSRKMFIACKEFYAIKDLYSAIWRSFGTTIFLLNELLFMHIFETL